MKAKKPSVPIHRTYVVNVNSAKMQVLAYEGCEPYERYTVLGSFSFDRVYGDLEVSWTVDGRRVLSMSERLSHILHFVNFLLHL